MLGFKRENLGLLLYFWITSNLSTFYMVYIRPRSTNKLCKGNDVKVCNNCDGDGEVRS